MAADSSSKKNGPAIGKRAKIDKAQRNMLIAVGIASVLFGVTLVLVVYFAKTIAFNAKMIGAKDDIVKVYKNAQTSLESISSQINELATNENFESVGRQQSENCKDSSSTKEVTEYSLDEIEKVRECSALRVITDALPSSQNIETTFTSFIILLQLPENGSTVSNVNGGDIGSATLGDSQLNTINVTLRFDDDDENRIMNSLSSIESSIRNFDIKSASLTFRDDEGGLEISAEYNAYFSSKAGLRNLKKVICADDKSDKCTKAGGDGYVTELSDFETGN